MAATTDELSQPGGASSRQARPARRSGKFRLERGPLRWWLMAIGALVVNFAWSRFYVGAGLALAAAVLHLVSKAHLRQDKALTVAGPYRFTRNPFYLANLIAEMGLLVIIGRVWLAVLYLVLWARIYHKQILAEENTLTRLFPQEFAHYCRQVPRFFPRPWRYLPREQVRGPRFSWRNPNIYYGSAIERALRLVAYPVLLLAIALLDERGLRSLLSIASAPSLALAAFLALMLAGRLCTWSRLNARKHLVPGALTPTV